MTEGPTNLGETDPGPTNTPGDDDPGPTNEVDESPDRAHEDSAEEADSEGGES